LRIQIDIKISVLISYRFLLGLFLHFFRLPMSFGFDLVELVKVPIFGVIVDEIDSLDYWITN